MMAKPIPKYLIPTITVLHFFITKLPLKVAYFVMVFVMVKGGEVFLKPKNMRRNIREAFPDLEEPAVEAVSKKILANFGRHIVEILHIASFKEGKRGFRVDLSTPEGATFDGKGPAIYIGAHVGSWELCPIVFAERKQPLTIIYTENDSPTIDNLLMQSRKQTGCHYVEKDNALRACYQALNRGEAIGLLVDQRVKLGVDVDFFDKPTAMSRIPARLAMNFNCPIIPMDVVRIKPGHLRVIFHEAIRQTGETGKQAELELTQQIACAIQASITRNVDSWFCNKLRWKSADKNKFPIKSYNGR